MALPMVLFIVLSDGRKVDLTNGKIYILILTTPDSKPLVLDIDTRHCSDGPVYM